MQNLFNAILKISVSAVPVIVVVLCLRQFFKKYPKSYSFALWLIVFASLAVPFKIPVNIALPTEKVTEEITQTIVQEFTFESLQNNAIEQTEGQRAEQNKDGNTAKVPVVVQKTEQSTVTAPQNIAQQKMFTLQLWHIWLGGLLVLMAFEIVNLKGIYDKTRFAFRKEGNIYLCDEINKPFVFGIVKPKIFIPSDISPQNEGYVIQHEQTHIARRDYITKPLCFAIASVHWFNPFVWLAFYLMEKDMELSCDEKVAKFLDTDGIKQYCTALLAFAVKDKPYKINAVLFGEGNCTMRIKNILNFRQPKKLTAILLSICVLFAGCTAFTTGETANENTENENNTALLYVEHLEEGVLKTITDENSVKVISEILASQNWQEGTADCLSEFKITLDGNEYYYHSDCGTINDNKTDQSLSLNDTHKSEIDRIIASMPQTEKASESNNTCGYPTQEYFTEETESVKETETADQWSAFPEVIHLPMLEMGKYIFPLDMTNETVRINRGYTGQYPKHDGIDFAGPFGTEIFASADGKVIKSEESSVGDGNHVVIEHANGYYTLYAHCSELLVNEGDEVKQGYLIAKMGSTGNSTGNHLHFEFGFGYGSEPDCGLTLDPYTAVGTRCLEDLG